MSQKNLLLFALVALLMLAVAYNMKRHAYEDFVDQKSQLVRFEKEAREIGMLKKRFGKQATKRQIATLKRIAAPQKELVKSDRKILVFDQLDATKLNALLRKIANSGLRIKKLAVSRIDDLHAKVRVEIAK